MTKYSIIIPFYKDISIAKNAVLSAARQFRSTKAETVKYQNFTIECVIVNDSPDVDAEPLLQCFNENKLFPDYTCRIVNMPSNQGEGNARRLGIEKCTGEYFFLIDQDDVFGPNCVSKCNEIIVNETEKNHKISMVEYPFSSFDVGYTHIIEPYSIWVQSKCYNKSFIQIHNISSTDLSSRAGADYNLITKLHGIQDYYDRKYQYLSKSNTSLLPEWVRVIANQENAYSWSYWYPSDSQTRKCNYWGTWINCKTILNGLDAVNFVRSFEENHGENRREYWKHDALNKCCYNFINLHDFLRASTINPDWKKKVISIDDISGEDNNITMYELFKRAYLGVAEMGREFIDEWWDMDIYASFGDVWNHSDCHKCQPWLDFKSFIKDPYSTGLFDFNNMKELIDYCEKNYSFDGNGYPLSASPYQAFIKNMSK